MIIYDGYQLSHLWYFMFFFAIPVLVCGLVIPVLILFGVVFPLRKITLSLGISFAVFSISSIMVFLFLLIGVMRKAIAD
jgi:hypothetical protein